MGKFRDIFDRIGLSVFDAILTSRTKFDLPGSQTLLIGDALSFQLENQPVDLDVRLINICSPAAMFRVMSTVDTLVLGDSLDIPRFDGKYFNIELTGITRYSATVYVSVNPKKRPPSAQIIGAV